MAVDELLQSGRLSWFGTEGVDSDVVLSSRVRLARNLVGLPFPGRADLGQLAEIQQTLDTVLADIDTEFGQPFDRIAIDQLSALEREVLIEKRLISEKFAEALPYRMAYISADTRVSILVNEDDHLHIQSMTPGLSLTEAFETASHVDDYIEARLDLAFDETMGYLTAYPTNLGTGLRAAGAGLYAQHREHRQHIAAAWSGCALARGDWRGSTPLQGIQSVYPRLL